MGTSKINNFMKHKRIIFISLILIGFLLLVFLYYILSFTTNKPVLFGDKKNKVSKSCKYFDFTVSASSITYKNGSSNGTIKCCGEISNLKEDIKNVTIEFEVASNWTSDTTYTNTSVFDFNDKGILKKTTDTKTTYYSDSCNLTLKTDFPYKVKKVPLVKIKHPTIYAKVTFTRCKPESLEEAKRTETVYFKIPYAEYCTNATIIK